MGELVSVIMSTYNEKPKWIQESIESILNQTYENIEFIIVLDNPDNNSINELILSYSSKDSRINVVKNAKNLGLTASLNSALLFAKGDYIARMDADDISALNRFEKQINYIRENNLDFVFSAMNIINEKGEAKFKSSDRVLPPKSVNILSSISNVATHPTWFLKKAIYDMLGGYREVPFCEDYDFVLRSISHGFKIGRMPDLLLSYRVRESSITNTNALEQFHNARGVKNLYKQNKLEDIEELTETLKKSKEDSSESEIVKFNNGFQLLNAGINEIKNKKILSGVSSVFRGCFASPLVIHRSAEWLRFRIVEFSLEIVCELNGKFRNKNK